jgi:acetolactate decarboxylase
LFQYSTIPALLAGLYDGEWTCGEVRRHGDLGLGTFDALDGEMVVLDGHCYRSGRHGKALLVSDAEKTPFACVTFFEPDWLVSNVTVGSLSEFIAALDRHLPSPNVFFALRLDGNFGYMKTRSVPRQAKPYRPLTEIVKTQPTFAWRDVRGTLLGFRCPAFASELNVAGWHLHFITADRTGGGHVLDLRLTNQTVALDITPAFRVTLSTNATFLKLKLDADSSEAVRQVEK